MKHGVEQEIQVVNQEGRLVYEVEKILSSIPDDQKKYKTQGGIYKDVYSTQLEISTGAANDLDDLQNQLIELRTIVAEKARKNDLYLIATGANHLLKPNVGELFAEQHHIDAESNFEKLRLSNFIRIFTPELFAMSVNSPIGQGRVTKWKSFRASIQSMDASERVNPNIKAAPYLKMQDIERGFLENFSYEPTFEKKRKKSRYYDVSPFTQKDRYTQQWKPTIEIRLFDTQPSIPLTMAYSAIVEALALKSKRFKKVPNLEIHYNRSQAIERGLQAHFIVDQCREFSFLPYQKTACSDANVILQLFLEWLDDEIKELGYEQYLIPVKTMVKQQRDLADWQVDLYQRKRENYIPTLIEKTMEDFDKEIISHSVDIVLVNKKEKETKIDPVINENVSFLMNELRNIHRVGPRGLISSLVSIGEVLPEKKAEMDDSVRQAISLVGLDGSVKNDSYLTAYLMELLIAFDKTEESEFDRLSNWLFNQIKNNELSQGKVWLNAYILSVLKRIGYDKKDVDQGLSWLEKQVDKEIEPWVLAYVAEAFTVYGLSKDHVVQKIIDELDHDHWSSRVIDDTSVTALIYRLLRNTGYHNDDVVNWLKNQLRQKEIKGKLSLHQLSLVLRSLSEDVVAQ
jgi:gamma-glutamyl:cysteine ligase YbdK (ATP-grasp superfamily)